MKIHEQSSYGSIILIFNTCQSFRNLGTYPQSCLLKFPGIPKWISPAVRLTNWGLYSKIMSQNFNNQNISHHCSNFCFGDISLKLQALPDTMHIELRWLLWHPFIKSCIIYSFVWQMRTEKPWNITRGC